MKLKVICKKCDRIFSWNGEKDIEICPYCDSDLTIKDVRMNPSEMLRYKKFKDSRRFTKAEKDVEDGKLSQPVLKKPTIEPTIRSARKPPVTPSTPGDDLEGKYIIRKGKTKYGTLELTNPDYMILKISFWAMGPQQKEITKSLTKKIFNDLARNGFDFKKR